MVMIIRKGYLKDGKLINQEHLNMYILKLLDNFKTSRKEKIKSDYIYDRHSIIIMMMMDILLYLWWTFQYICIDF